MEYRKIAKVSEKSQQNNSEKATKENEKKIQKLIDNVRTNYNSIIMEYQKIKPNQPPKFRTKKLGWNEWWITWNL